VTLYLSVRSWRNHGSGAKDKLASAANSAWSPAIGKCFERSGRIVDGMGNAISSGRIPLMDAGDNSRKIGRSFGRPFDLHWEPNQEPRIRSIRRRTSSWETVLP
jgi:hypothetical protein